MANSSLVALGRKLDRLESNLTSGKGARAVSKIVGDAAIKDADEVLRSTGSRNGSLADASMSHWPRSNPFELTTRARNLSDHEVQIEPSPKARGPWRVLESGREAHVKGNRRESTRTSKKTGKPLKGRLIKRTGGASVGKGVWTKVEATVAQRTPPRVADAVHDVIAKSLTGG